jgi:hypothetical protein
MGHGCEQGYQEVNQEGDGEMTLTSMSHADYDRIEAVRSTRLLKLLDCPAAYNVPVEETPALLFGRAFHSYLLQPELFVSEYAIKPVCDGRTKEGIAILKSFKESLEDNVSVISKDDFDTIVGMGKSVLSHPTASEWLSEGIAEVPAVWIDPETGIKCKTLADWIIPGRIIDLKSCQKGKSNAWSFYREAVFSYHYHISGAMRLEGFLQLGKTYQDYSFIVVEKEPPYYKTSCFDMDTSMIEEGFNEYKRLLRELKQHLDSGQWPAYSFSGSETLTGHKEG